MQTRIPLLTLSNKQKLNNIKQTLLQETPSSNKHRNEGSNKSTRKAQAEELAANKEYILSLKNALKEVIDENELV